MSSDLNVFEYLLNGTYPAGIDKNAKRCLRSKAQNYSIPCGQRAGEVKMFYQVCAKGRQKLDSKKERSISKRKVILSDEEKLEKMTELHGSITGGGHLGLSKTLHKIEERYFWTNMSKDIRHFVASCSICQRMNKKFTSRSKEIHPIKIEKPQFFHFVAIDCITSLPLTLQGNCNIIVVTCKFTKFAFARSTSNIQATTIANFLYELFCMFGWPQILLSDQGRETCNQIVDTLTSIIDKRTTSSYHPQCNGQVSLCPLCCFYFYISLLHSYPHSPRILYIHVHLYVSNLSLIEFLLFLQVERLNQTLEAMLRKAIDDDGLEGAWDTYVPGECISE